MKPAEKARASLLLAWFLIVLTAYFRSYSFPPISLYYVLTAPSQTGLFLSSLGRIVISLGIAFWILWLAYQTGQRLLRRLLSPNSLAGQEAIVFSEVIGLGLLAYGVFFLGCAGLWYRSVFLSLALFSSYLYIRKPLKNSSGRIPLPWSDRQYALWGWVLGAFIVTFLLADLAPEIFYDSLYYHLAVPNLYRLAHHIYGMPSLLFSNFVFSLHMLYGLAITIGNTAVAKLLHGGMATLLAIAFITFGARYLSPGSGLLSAVLFISMPLVGMNTATAGIDVAASLIQFTAGFALIRALTENNRSWFFLAGLLTGFSASCKLPAWSYIPLSIVFISWYNWRHQKKIKMLSSGLVFLLPAMALPGIFWVRNWAFHGNPFYPMGGTFWGHPLLAPWQWQTFISDANVRMLSNEFSNGTAFIRFLFHPWFITMEGHGNGDSMGPMVLMCLPALFLIRRISAPARLLALYGLSGWLLWLLTSNSPRYGLPALTMVLPAVAEGITFITRPMKSRKWLLLGPLVLAAGINFISLSGNLCAKGGWEVIAGQKSEADYLGAEHPSYPAPPYEAIAWMNQTLPSDAKILFIGEPRTYYIERRAVTGSVPDLQPLVSTLRQSADAKELRDRLQQEGISHLFFNLAEAYRTRSYNLFPWSLVEWVRLDEFWKRYVVLVWKKEGEDQALYVYRLLSDEESVQQHPIPPNPFEPWRPQR